MPLYFAAHTTACLTKQSLRELMRKLLGASEVKIRRAVASQHGGRMLTEAEAPDQSTLEKFFEAQNINCQWVVRIDLDAHGDSVTDC
jgi:hypothetical protein